MVVREGRPLLVRAFAAVPVFETNDVVFAEIRARLHFDDLQRDLPGFSMRCFTPTGMYVDWFSSSRNVSSPRVMRAVPKHHDPVLGAMVMQLQGELRARLHATAASPGSACRSPGCRSCPRGRNTSRCRGVLVAAQHP